MELAFSIVSHIRPDRSSWLCGNIWVPALLGVKQTNKVDIRLSLGTNIVYDCYHIGNGCRRHIIMPVTIMARND